MKIEKLLGMAQFVLRIRREIGFERVGEVMVALFEAAVAFGTVPGRARTCRRPADCAVCRLAGAAQDLHDLVKAHAPEIIEDAHVMIGPEHEGSSEPRVN